MLLPVCRGEKGEDQRKGNEIRGKDRMESLDNQRKENETRMTFLQVRFGGLDVRDSVLIVLYFLKYNP